MRPAPDWILFLLLDSAHFEYSMSLSFPLYSLTIDSLYVSVHDFQWAFYPQSPADLR